jgi:hypothetical protein
MGAGWTAAPVGHDRRIRGPELQRYEMSHRDFAMHRTDRKLRRFLTPKLEPRHNAEIWAVLNDLTSIRSEKLLDDR